MAATGGEPERKLAALAEFAARARNPTLTEIVDRAGADVVAAFEQHGIPVRVVKGAALARYLYEHGERRTYMDVDLLVSPGDRGRAGGVLAALGYENIYAQHGVDEFTGAVHAESWHGRAAGQMPVDLHWRLPGCTASPELIWERLSRDPLPVEMAGRTVLAPALAGLALHVGLHAAQHGPADTKSMGDLARALVRWPWPEWDAATRLAHELGGTRMFAAGLRLLPAGAELADALGLPEAGDLVWEIRHRRSRPRGTFHLSALREARGPRELVTVLWRSLLPTRAWITAEYPWAQGSRLRLAAGYARHVARTPIWALRAWRFQRRARRGA